MKKLGLIILMALVLTVGGVYAAFSYAREEVASVTTQALAKGIAEADTKTPKGTIEIVGTKDVMLRIDDAKSNHKTGLEIGNSVIKVTFTPAANAEPLVVDECINMKLPTTQASRSLQIQMRKTKTAVSLNTRLISANILPSTKFLCLLWRTMSVSRRFSWISKMRWLPLR